MSRKTEVRCDFCGEETAGRLTGMVKFAYEGKDVGVYIYPVRPHRLQRAARSLIPYEGVGSYDTCPDCQFKIMEVALAELVAPGRARKAQEARNDGRGG